MSEPLAERLSRFTPESGLDRDALLFAAGRASARPNRRWAALAAALAASQVLTLVCLWPAANAPVPSPPPAPFALPGPSDAPPPPRDPSGLVALSERLLAPDGDWPPPADVGPMIDPEPPLRVSDAPPAKYFN